MNASPAPAAGAGVDVAEDSLDVRVEHAGPAAVPNLRFAVPDSPDGLRRPYPMPPNTYAAVRATIL